MLTQLLSRASTASSTLCRESQRMSPGILRKGRCHCHAGERSCNKICAAALGLSRIHCLEITAIRLLLCIPLAACRCTDREGHQVVDIGYTLILQFCVALANEEDCKLSNKLCEIPPNSLDDAPSCSGCRPRPCSRSLHKYVPSRSYCGGCSWRGFSKLEGHNRYCGLTYRLRLTHLTPC